MTGSRRVLPALKEVALRRDGNGLAGPGIAVLAGSPRLRRKDSEATDRDATATGKGIGDGREHGTHGGVGARLGYGRSATTQAESSALFIQVPALASVRVSVSRYPRLSQRIPQDFIGPAVPARMQVSATTRVTVRSILLPSGGGVHGVGDAVVDERTRCSGLRPTMAVSGQGQRPVSGARTRA